MSLLFVFCFLFALIYSKTQQDVSICDKYSQALNISNDKLLNTIVGNTVTGLVANGTMTKQFFDGTKPPGSTNFLDPAKANALKALVSSLVQFFGGALGCSDGTISPYTGPKMDAIHQPMGINVFTFLQFNNILVEVLNNAGVSENDQVAVRIVLESLKDDIVMQGSFCDKYSKALKLTNKELVTTVITKVFGAITADGAPTKKYFNGEKPKGSLNFLDAKNKLALDGLVNGLVTFFGSALMCSDMTIGPYGGGSMMAVHHRMGINGAEFDFFNSQVVKVLRDSGVVANDLKGVVTLLNSTRSDIVTHRL